MARVNYAKHVSDEHLKTVLQRLANFLNKDVNVHSGDRSFVPRGGSRTSLHLAHRAADLHVVGMSDADVFNAIRANTGSILDRTQGYEVIRHGVHTETGGPHIHIGHYGAGRHDGQVLFKLEGLTPPGGHYDVTPQAIGAGTPVPSGTSTQQRPTQSRPTSPSTGGGTTSTPTRTGRATIRASVGRGGSNRRSDVETVQMLLNRARRRLRQAGGGANLYHFLREDGICGPRTRAAIVLFQQHVVRFRHPDGRVDPGGRTMRLLNTANTGVPQSTNTRVRQEVNTPPQASTPGRVVSNPNASPAELLADPRVRAMLEVLAFTEGTGDDYGKVVNGVVERAPIYPQYIGRRNVSITDLSRHPQLYVRWARGQPLSSAAGRYQFLYDTWTSVGQGDFGRRSQDVGAVILMKRRNMIAPLLRDDLEQAVFHGAPEWASLPKNARNEGYYSGQSARTLDQIRARYTQALARFGR